MSDQRRVVFVKEKLLMKEILAWLGQGQAEIFGRTAS
jgi:hypothetical protein